MTTRKNIDDRTSDSMLSMGNPEDLPYFQTRTLQHELRFWDARTSAVSEDRVEYLDNIRRELRKRGC